MAVPIFERIGGEVVTEAFEAARGVQPISDAAIVFRRFDVITPDDGKPPITEIGQQRNLVVAKESKFAQFLSVRTGRFFSSIAKVSDVINDFRRFFV